VAFPIKFVDGKARQVSAELVNNIQEQKARPLTQTSAKLEINNVNMKYMNYSRRQLKEALLEMFVSLGLIERFQIDV